MAQPADPRNAGKRWLRLLILPWIGVLLVPVYNRDEPRLFGLPFFYWYQLLWVLISAALTAIVYLKTRPKRGGRGAGR
ncbi:MAG: DUF3311 domain-containing protein [Pararobbsia sp.]